ncbi:MAG: HmuY family protein [Bacteroidetes bacterium]|nr:HmuY family protein [Bacteroidota bacterium]
MKRTLRLTAIFGTAIALFTSCSKDDATAAIDTSNNGTFKIFTQGKVTTVQNLMADTIIGLAPSGQPYGSNRFTFYSIENNALVASSDSATNKWDIAFRGTTILTNAGTSGPGNGGAFVQVGTFDALTTISPDSTFRTDAAPVYAIKTGSGKGWYNYDGANNLITPLPGRVLVIRTASGKYAKLEITNYYKKGVTPAASAPDDEKLHNQRYYEFHYTFQPNGTTTF